MENSPQGWSARSPEKVQPDQTQTEVDSAIKNDGELQKKIFLKSEDYLAGGSAKAVDQINNKLMKDIHQKTSGEIRFEKTVRIPLKVRRN